MCLGQVTTDPDRLASLQAAISEASAKLPKGVKHTKLLERDCYLWAEVRRDFLWVGDKLKLQRARLEEILAEARAVIASDAYVRLLDDFARAI